MSLAQSVYNTLPVFLQNAGISAYGWYWKRLRLGGVFESRLSEWRERESWSADRLRQWRTERLRDVLLLAWDTTSLYPRLWASRGITRQWLEKCDPDSPSRLPVVSKDELRKAPRCNWRDSGRQGIDFIRWTSGSTGTPLAVGFAREVFQDIYAATEARALNWAGVSIRQPRAMIGSRPIIPPSQSKPPFWRYNIFEKQVYLSANHLSPSTVYGYRDTLNRFKPVTMVGHSSGYGMLAWLLEEAGLEIHSPRAVIPTSDTLQPGMKSAIERVFRAPVHQTWGMVENCAFATTCERGSLHIQPDFGIVEVLDEHDQPVGAGTTGRLVVTGLVNTSSLFVRYDTGDLGALSDEPCPCGRDNFPVLKTIVGRVEDVVVGANGMRVRRFDRVFTDIGRIRRAQVIQESGDLIRVLVEAGADFGGEETGLITGRIRDLLGDMRIEVERVESIAPEPNGKFRAVVSRLGQDNPGQPARES